MRFDPMDQNNGMFLVLRIRSMIEASNLCTRLGTVYGEEVYVVYLIMLEVSLYLVTVLSP